MQPSRRAVLNGYPSFIFFTFQAGAIKGAEVASYPRGRGLSHASVGLGLC